MRTTRETGKLGEDIACKWLVKHGYLVLERNYLKKWGELDIVATKDKKLHFIEVKSVFKDQNSMGSHRPEENVHSLKVRRLRRTIQTYLLERGYEVDVEFLFHILTVELDGRINRAHINLLENIIL